MEASTIVLLIAHGSRAAGTAEAHAALCAEVAGRTGGEVRPAFLELSSPEIPEAIDAAVADGATRVVLLPHFLAAGNHMRRDIPAAADEARARHPEVDIDLATPLGAHPGIVDLLADLTRDALA